MNPYLASLLTFVIAGVCHSQKFITDPIWSHTYNINI
jgi:hypothetical protein